MSPSRVRIHPAVLLVAATVLSGGCGYLIGILVPARVSASEYATFAVVWSALFFVVGSFGGLQQEFARASTPSEGDRADGTGARRTLVFALVTAIAVGVVLAATSPMWQPAVIPDAAPAASWAIAVGVAGYILVAICCGALYGLKAWPALAVLLGLDGVLRLTAVVIVLAIGGSGAALAWAIVVPFPLALVIVLPFVARRLRRDTVIDVSWRALAVHSAQLVVAAAATAALVSGVPLLLRLALPGIAAVHLAPILLALTLTRAPIVIPLLALQSYLVVRFRDAGSGRAVRLAMGVLVAGALLAVLVALLGPPLMVAVFGPAYQIGSAGIGLIVGSSGTLAAMCVVTAALIARGRHSANTGAWLAAVGATVGLLLVVHAQTETRVGVALLGGSVIGLIVHFVALAATNSRTTVAAP